MQSPFVVNEQPLILHRFPIAQVNRSLQAWDSADEYILQHLMQHDLLNQPRRFLIFNDSFGALTCNLTGHNVTAINDSYVSQQGIRYNLDENFLPSENITLLDSLHELPEQVDIILFKLPKSKALLTHQLAAVRKQYSNNVVFIAAGKAKEIHTSTLALFEKYIGDTKTSLAVKKSRLIFSEINTEPALPMPANKTWPLENGAFTIHNLANVFARDKLDIGARFFLQHLPELKDGQQIIDLGCGNGVIGLSALAKKSVTVTFTDESYMAIASARTNVEKNLPEKLDNANFLVNDCLTDIADASADVVLCNPPFHQQQATTDHIAWQMFKQSFAVLKPGGELRIVGNRQLGYHVKLKRLFGNATLIASDKKFVVLSAIKQHNN
ncbi:methyltransferase [Thalassotalea agarivorans]|uniref:Ribosomal RNA large subunit methyltransferase G n=1 Tax=Thalassotalea agarivorans TaxID=349064 RepID=A0A1H9YFL6_THASX|nr:methyltransferase [Thalassotalea agarivorans]SES67742.1 16S rRNA (guanine1207-N2)-methyltransferase [Thalassotalea agarivorans]